MDGVDNILYNFRKWLQARFFSSDTDDRSHGARKQKETLHSFLRDIH